MVLRSGLQDALKHPWLSQFHNEAEEAVHTGNIGTSPHTCTFALSLSLQARCSLRVARLSGTELIIDDNKKFPIAEYRSTLYNDIKKKRKERRRRAKLLKKEKTDQAKVVKSEEKKEKRGSKILKKSEEKKEKRSSKILGKREGSKRESRKDKSA